MGREKSGTQHRQRSRKQVAKARKEWVSGREVESVTVDQAVADLRSRRPKWEGLQSFDRVWDDAIATAITEENNLGGIPAVSCLGALAQRSARTLREGHPINFGRAQLEAVLGIGEADGVSPWEFLAETNLPFSEMFFDYSATGASPTRIPWGDNGETLSLYGAAVAFQSYENAPFDSAYSSRQKHIVPYGTEVVSEDDQTIASRPAFVDADGNQFQIRSATSLGEFALIEEVDEAEARPQFIAVTNEASDGLQEIRCAIPVRCLPELIGDVTGEAQAAFGDAPAGAILFVGAQPDLLSLIATSTLEDGGIKFPIPFEDAPEQAKLNIVTDAIMVLSQVGAIIDSLYFLDAHNVSIAEDVPVSRQVRRQVERSGGKIHIAKTVRVAPTNIKRTPTKGKGGTANYSHRFERRGYTRHVTRGSHAKADLMKPCYRRDAEGTPTCPDGCRREWCPPTIVGNDDLPFVPKARIVPGPNVEN
jgi:hypothetical protein